MISQATRRQSTRNDSYKLVGILISFAATFNQPDSKAHPSHMFGNSRYIRTKLVREPCHRRAKKTSIDMLNSNGLSLCSLEARGLCIEHCSLEASQLEASQLGAFQLEPTETSPLERGLFEGLGSSSSSFFEGTSGFQSRIASFTSVAFIRSS